MKLPLSVVIISKNEETRLKNCLSSVQFAEDAFVLLDEATTDRSEDVCRSLGARVERAAWRGFGAQKQLAVEKAHFDWILSVDSDEEVSPGLAAEIQARWSELDPQTAYRLPRSSFHLGRWIRHGGWYPDYQVRLFHRKHSKWDLAPIHEKVLAPKLGAFDKPLLHFLFEDLADQINTNNRYSSLLAEKDFKEGRRFSLVRLLVKPWTKFFECYLWKQGFRDGLPGFIIAVGAGYSIFLRQAKLWELSRAGSKS